MSFGNYINLDKSRNFQNGQILLIVVLTMVVALTVGLSVASRVVTELRLSKQNEESERAFQAAEAGIQESLRSQTDIPLSSLSNNSNFKTTFVIPTASSIVLVNNGLVVDQVSGADVWLSKYDKDSALNFGSPMTGSATIYWGDPVTQTSCSSGSGNATIPAIEVAMLQNKAAPTIVKYVFEGDGCTRIPGVDPSSSTNSSLTDSSGVTILFSNTATINFAQGLVMKVIPIYNSTKIGLVSGGPNFPSQGSTVESEGKSGDTVRKVKFFKSYPQIPLEAFPYSILSQ